jgi:hypothetical protein
MKTSHLQNFNVDKLTRNLIMDTIEWDKKDNLDKPPIQRQNKHQDDLLKAIRSCGVTFNIWGKQNADGKGSGLYDFTSLMGSDKKLLLKTLPNKLATIIKPETSETVIQIWKVIFNKY